MNASISDESLMDRCTSGDVQALNELLRRHGPAVQRTLQISPIWQGELDSADVMQVTYLEAFLHLRTLDRKRGRSFVAWLRSLAENNLRDAIRGLERDKRPSARNRIRPARMEDSLSGLYELLGTHSATPSRRMRRDEIVRMLMQAIASLPERYAQVVRLYDLEGNPIADVARQSGRSAGAVHMLRARAHDLLRERLGSESGFFV